MRSTICYNSVSELPHVQMYVSFLVKKGACILDRCLWRPNPDEVHVLIAPPPVETLFDSFLRAVNK